MSNLQASVKCLIHTQARCVGALCVHHRDNHRHRCDGLMLSGSFESCFHQHQHQQAPRSQGPKCFQTQFHFSAQGAMAAALLAGPLRSHLLDRMFFFFLPES